MYTDYRPTPLQHYMFPAGGDGLYMIVDERGVFREDSFQKSIAALTAKDGTANGDGNPRSLTCIRVWVVGKAPVKELGMGPCMGSSMS